MIVLGIDPGQTGGLAVVSKRGLLGAWPIPLTLPTKKPTVFFAGVVNLVAESFITTAVIEQVHAMPAQGVSSSFQFGRMYGGVEMMAQWLADEVEYVTPQQWKKYFKLGKEKGEAVALATEMYGDKHWKLKKHEGVAEAALIATWGLHQLGQK